MNCRISQLAELCRNKTVYIQTHNFPDPDAIASAYGLQKLLRHFGISSELCYAGRIDKLSATKMLQMFGIEMHSYDRLREYMNESDYIICVDSQKNAGNVTDFIGHEVAAIEHIKVYDTAGFSFIPFSCPDALIATISDFILSLEEVEIAVICSRRQDGIKLSVRSETSKAHAGELIREAIKEFGSGGGHAGMAGGLIPLKNLKLLGEYPENRITQLFLDELDHIDRSKQLEVCL